MSALFAYISTNPVGPLICMAIIVGIVLAVRAILKVPRNQDGYISAPDPDEPAPDKPDSEE